MSSAIERACAIYCDGELLSTIQMARLYNDSKTFVDMPMKIDPEDILNAFNTLSEDDKQDKKILQAFVDKYFDEAGSDLEEYLPTDFSDNPAFIADMDDKFYYKSFASSLNQLWKILGRRVTQEALDNPQRHSFLLRNYPMIVPGGRFRESYYWDSYWIIRGLLVCDMHVSAYNVIMNLLDDINELGFVPNGGRIYYLDRSQPPLLSEMVKEYYQYMKTKFGYTEDLKEFLEFAYQSLEKEYSWWMSESSQHSININDFLTEQENTEQLFLNRYYSNFTTPRPESFVEDFESAGKSSRSRDFYRSVRAGAETGWDFSSRWIGGAGDVSQIHTEQVIPVELNAILYRNELNLAEFQAILGGDGSVNFTDNALRRRDAIQRLLWDEESFHWRDFNLTGKAFSRPVDVSGAAISGYQSIAYYLPLWAQITPPSTTPASSSEDRNAMIVSALQESQLIQVAGVLTTNFNSQQQWDSPNAWAPLVLMTVEGLLALNTSHSRSLAANISASWLQTCSIAFEKTGFMYEKYNAFEMGVGGGGGEYVPQIGFGWSNAVALLLIKQTYLSYSSGLITADDDDDSNQHSLSKPLLAVIVTFAIVIPVTLIAVMLCAAYKREMIKRTQAKYIRAHSSGDYPTDAYGVEGQDQVAEKLLSETI